MILLIADKINFVDKTLATQPANKMEKEMTDEQNKPDIKISDKFNITEIDSLRKTSRTFEIEITSVYFNEYWRAKFKGKQSGHIGEIPVDILAGTDATLDDARGPRWTFEVSKIA